MTERRRKEQVVETIERGATIRIGSILPVDGGSGGGRDRRPLLLAAGALLALVTASGSFATMAARTVRGSLR